MNDLKHITQQPNTQKQKFYCTICCVQFPTLEERNIHLKSDFHIFNAKRQAVLLDPISYEKFIAIQEAEKKASIGVEVKIFNCSLCKKKYVTQQKMNEHINSKKHKANMRRYPERAENCISEIIVDDESSSDSEDIIENVSKIITREELKQQRQRNEEKEQKCEKCKESEKCYEMKDKFDESKQVDEKEKDTIQIKEEDITDEQLDKFIQQRKSIAPKYTERHCLFCNNESEDIEKNLEHMEKTHAFFIPNIECCCDIAGLLMYLHDKICIGYMCIWCEHVKPAFKHYKDVRQHMIDSCHCKMLYENENLDEYDEFYDYSSIAHTVEIVSMDDTSMTLSNGKVIGHRSMALYYKQNVRSVESRELVIQQNKEKLPIAKESINRCVGSKALITQNDMDYIENVKDVLRRQITNKSVRRENQTTYRKWTRAGIKFNKLFVPRTWLYITSPNQL